MHLHRIGRKRHWVDGYFGAVESSRSDRGIKLGIELCI